MPDVGLSETPVFRDGLTTQRTYAFIAAKKGEPYNGVVYAFSKHKLKFYPNAQFWGITQSMLKAIDHSLSLYERPDYQGVYGVERDHVQEVLKILHNQRGVSVVPTDLFMGYQESMEHRHASADRHPSGPRVPAKLPSYQGPRA